jgi:predicted lipoprotein with Yx(FWY)xxD motif
MKTILSAFAVLLASSAYSLAADPAKIMESPKGKIYTTDSGMTLYTFDEDTDGKSKCEATCTETWQPFKAAADAKASGKWTIVTRLDGSHMWAFDGKPLYTFALDTKAGEMRGNDMGGAWHIVKAE